MYYQVVEIQPVLIHDNMYADGILCHYVCESLGTAQGMMQLLIEQDVDFSVFAVLITPGKFPIKSVSS